MGIKIYNGYQEYKSVSENFPKFCESIRNNKWADGYVKRIEKKIEKSGSSGKVYEYKVAIIIANNGIMYTERC